MIDKERLPYLLATSRHSQKELIIEDLFWFPSHARCDYLASH